jgi:hypothetical protein
MARSEWELAYLVAMRRLARDDYAATRVPGYRVARFVARTLPVRARILGAGENLVYYYEREVLPTSWRSRWYDPEIGQRLLGFDRGAEVEAAARRHGLSHLVAVPTARHVTRRLGGSWIAREALWEEGPRLVYADGSRYLFELGSPLGPRVDGPSLLPDGGGGRGVEVLVRPGALYALEAQGRAGEGAGRVRLRIEWVDAAGRPLVAPPRREVTVGPTWRRVAMAATAPEGAVGAAIGVEPLAPAVAVRAVRFYELR